MSEQEKIDFAFNKLARVIKILKPLCKSNFNIQSSGKFQETKDQFLNLVQYIESTSTKMCIACDGCDVASDCVPFIEFMEQGITGFVQTVQTLYIETRAGPTLRGAIGETCIKLLGAVEGVCQGFLNRLGKEEISSRTGMVWSVCKELQECPLTNKNIVGRAVVKNIELVKDAIIEMEEILNESNKEKSENNSYNSEDDDGDDIDDFGEDALTEDEKRVIPYIVTILNLSKKSLTAVTQILQNSQAKSMEVYESYVNWLEDILKYSKDLSESIDELTSNIYSPQDLNQLFTFYNKVKDINLIILDLGTIENVINEQTQKTKNTLESYKEELRNLTFMTY